MGVQYEDRMTIETPEGVSVTVPLAGVGSRFVAATIDLAIQATIIIVAAVVFLGYGAGGGAGPGIFSIVVFLAFFVYDVAFEVLSGGRTPGKRWTGLRVVRAGGQPVNFVTSAIRNLIRPLDFLPSAYLVGIVSILATKRNQRLGDLAAGTVVARAPRKSTRPTLPPMAPAPVELPASLVAWDVSAITTSDIATVRSFLERRASLEWGARAELARTMATRLRPRVGGLSASAPLSDEAFLEQLARVKGARS
jgi:uncharacterized RDD family membrane protein YckC